MENVLMFIFNWFAAPFLVITTIVFFLALIETLLRRR